MAQLVGCNCVLCGERIASELDGRFCNQCGQPVHTRCIRSPSPFAEYGCAECGIDSGEVKQPPQSEAGPFPVGTACPKCAAGEYRVVKPEAFVAFRWDRVCKACGTRYTPPTPMWAGGAFILLGLVLAVIGGVSVVFRLRDPNPIGIPAMACEGFLCVLGLLAIGHGIRSLMKPGRV